MIVSNIAAPTLQCSPLSHYVATAVKMALTMFGSGRGFFRGQRVQHVLADLRKPFLERDVRLGLGHLLTDDRRQEHFVADMLAEAAIGFELGLAEELVHGRSVRKCRFVQPVALDELAL